MDGMWYRASSESSEPNQRVSECKAAQRRRPPPQVHAHTRGSIKIFPRQAVSVLSAVLAARPRSPLSAVLFASRHCRRRRRSSFAGKDDFGVVFLVFAGGPVAAFRPKCCLTS